MFVAVLLLLSQLELRFEFRLLVLAVEAGLTVLKVAGDEQNQGDGYRQGEPELVIVRLLMMVRKEDSLSTGYCRLASHIFLLLFIIYHSVFNSE